MLCVFSVFVFHELSCAFSSFVFFLSVSLLCFAFFIRCHALFSCCLFVPYLFVILSYVACVFHDFVSGLCVFVKVDHVFFVK